MEITLAPYEYEWAAHVGTGRMLARADSPNAKHYNNDSKLEPEIRATLASACCEIAVARAYNMYWGGHVWDPRDHHKYKNIADVGTTIEVRRVRKKGGPFAVRKNDVSLNRTMVAAFAHDPDFRTITVYGSIDAPTAWELSEPSPFFDEATRYCALSNLRSPL